MRNPYWLCSLAILILALGISPKAHAQDTNASQNHPYIYHASSYYDDLEDHYEQDQLMRDTIDGGY